MEIKQKTNSDKLHELTYRYPSESKLHMYRNLTYGAAGIQLLIIILLAQVTIEAKALTICLYSSSLGLPIWVGLGGLYEYYILLGKRSYSHLRSGSGKIIILGTFSFAGMTILISVGSLMHYLDKTSLWFFGAGTILIISIASIFQLSLADSIFQDKTE